MTESTYTENDLVTFAATMSRVMMARALGQTAYEGDRDYYEVLGYPAIITPENYEQRYARQDIASRIVDLPAIDTWKNPPKVSENDNEETAFVQEWDALATRLRAWNVLSRADALSGVGRFGIILIGVRNGNDLSQPIEAGSLSGQKDILYLRAFSEANVEVKDFDEKSQSPRFGMPETYAVKTRDKEGRQTIHWTRIIHLADGKRDSEVFGTPRLRPVYNLLDDLMKVIGGTAEATWLNMRPGLAIGPDEGYDWQDTDEAKAAWLQEVKRYAHDPLRMMRLVGMRDPVSMGVAEVMDPRGPFEAIISLVSAATSIPQRKLMGSAAGELSASQEDTRQWASFIASRQNNYAEPEVFRPLVDRFIWYGALSVSPDGYDVGTLNPDGSRSWPSIIELSEEEVAKAQSDKANAVKLLEDPNTFELPITKDEARQLLGYPSEKTLEEESTPADDETVANQGTLEGVMAQAIINYREGTIEADQLAEFAVASWADVMGGDNETT